jgi:hypothetical protein
MKKTFIRGVVSSAHTARASGSGAERERRKAEGVVSFRDDAAAAVEFMVSECGRNIPEAFTNMTSAGGSDRCKSTLHIEIGGAG